MKKLVILGLLSCLFLCGCDTAKIEEKKDDFVNQVEENDITGKYINGTLYENQNGGD